MRRRKSDLSRRSRKARLRRRKLASLSEEQRALLKERNRQRAARLRAEESAEQRKIRLEYAREVRRLRYGLSRRNKPYVPKVTDRSYQKTTNQVQHLFLDEEHEIYIEIDGSNSHQIGSKSQHPGEGSNWESGSDKISIKSEPIFEEECE